MRRPKAERWYFGDPCYILPDNTYRETWGTENDFNSGEFSFGTRKDLPFDFCVRGTAYGDGGYLSSESITLFVDSGTLALVHESLFDKAKEQELLSKETSYVFFFKTISNPVPEFEDGIFHFTYITDNEIEKEFLCDTKEEEDEEDEEEFFCESCGTTLNHDGRFCDECEE